MSGILPTHGPWIDLVVEFPGFPFAAGRKVAEAYSLEAEKTQKPNPTAD